MLPYTCNSCSIPPLALSHAYRIRISNASLNGPSLDFILCLICQAIIFCTQTECCTLDYCHFVYLYHIPIVSPSMKTKVRFYIDFILDLLYIQYTYSKLSLGLANAPTTFSLIGNGQMGGYIYRGIEQLNQCYFSTEE